jgi:hypothetical protein
MTTGEAGHRPLVLYQIKVCGGLNSTMEAGTNQFQFSTSKAYLLTYSDFYHSSIHFSPTSWVLATQTLFMGELNRLVSYRVTRVELFNWFRQGELDMVIESWLPLRDQSAAEQSRLWGKQAHA